MRKKFYISGIALLILFFGVQLVRPYGGHSSSDPLSADFSSIFEDPLAEEDLCEEEEILATGDSTVFGPSAPFSFHTTSPVVRTPFNCSNLYLLHQSYLI